MRRIAIEPRPDYRRKIEEVCLAWHDKDDYWTERCFYEFTRREIDEIEAATNEVHARCLEAVERIIVNGNRYQQLGIPSKAIPLIERSWNDDWPSIYGRFDFAYNGKTPPKMLEYNADTPTCLLEAAVVQWYWLQDVFPASDQFNSIHERLVAVWQDLVPHLNGELVHFSSVDDVEDGVTITYLADTAVQAGLNTRTMPIEEIGWNGQEFVDSEEVPLRNLFKLYPWEFMANEEFFDYLLQTGTRWIEPPWKWILSSKGILPVLHEMFPYHPNILPAFKDSPRHLERFVQKPVFSREGQGVRILRRGDAVDTEETVFQQFVEVPAFAGNRYPILGSWVIGGEAAGMGIRESAGPITTNLSQFVPHRIADQTWLQRSKNQGLSEPRP